MNYETYVHRFADIILNSDYALKQEIEDVITGISFNSILAEFEAENQRRADTGKRAAQGKQSSIIVLSSVVISFGSKQQPRSKA